MASKTFDNLKLEKKEKFLTSAIKEFSQHSLGEASVASIIKEAEIPRGSFYQYFNDLEDLYYYILEDHSKEIKQKTVDLVIENNGDFIEAIKYLYDYFLNKITGKNNYDYFKNIFLKMDYKLEKMFLLNLEDNISGIINKIDISNLNIQNRLQLAYIVEIVNALLIRNLTQFYQRNLSKEKSIEIFNKEIEIIEKGLKKWNIVSFFYNLKSLIFLSSKFLPS